MYWHAWPWSTRCLGCCVKIMIQKSWVVSWLRADLHFLHVLNFWSAYDVIRNDSFDMTKRKSACYWLINSVPFFLMIPSNTWLSVPSTINAFDNLLVRFVQISPDWPVYKCCAKAKMTKNVSTVSGFCAVWCSVESGRKFLTFYSLLLWHKLLLGSKG